jgi:hypothetical protein
MVFLLRILRIVRLAECPRKLIAAGGILHAAVDAADSPLDLVDAHSLDQTRDSLQVALAAASSTSICVEQVPCVL